MATVGPGKAAFVVIFVIAIRGAVAWLQRIFPFLGPQRNGGRDIYAKLIAFVAAVFCVQTYAINLPDFVEFHSPYPGLDLIIPVVVLAALSSTQGTTVLPEPR